MKEMIPMAKKDSQVAQDERDVQILGILGEAHQGAVPGEADRAEVARALGQVVDTTDVSAPSDAEAASIALELLAEEPRFAGPIEAMKSGPPPEALSLGVVEGTFLIAGLLLVLQTYFEFERDKNGRWSIRIKKKPTSDALLKPLVKKLTELLGG
jgi:hypothetical protein